ncbi:cytochrome P450 6B6-like [Maniola jurtina]|uniref:cytochrome P450 6B6-like n=1 Tax=Maniola jurtina TaxID=191418 RepID=UPI001E68AB3E|nr:cytochrome P450 6B6-like [Maniola jurtina]
MILLISIILFVTIYFYINSSRNYWAKRNVKHEMPIPLFGNHLANFFGLKSMGCIASDLYDKYPNEKVVGYFRGPTPELIIRDPEIARHILNLDFGHFYPRGLARNEKKEFLVKNLFHADGDSWKLLRQRITPAFTTAKLKAMFPLIITCAEKLQRLGEGIVYKGGECDIRELMARFSTEFIGACGFGIEMDAINNENSVFRRLGKRMFDRSLKEMFLAGLWDIFPALRKTLRLVDKKVEKALADISINIFEQRNYKPSGRNDFVDLLLELAANGKIVGDSIEHRNPDGSPKEAEMEMDLQCLVAQVFVFFAAGFETSSSATSYTLHELAFNSEVQNEIQNEIDQVLSRYDNKLCYDAIAEMSLLDMALKESLRIFPALAILQRVCASKYTIPQLDITLDPGVKIIIPVQAIQNDEQYFPNPSEFRPERFTAKEVNARPKYVYMPFGEGPRACIGTRLGQMQSLAGLAAILHKFSVEPAEKTQRKLRLNHRLNVVQGVLGEHLQKLGFRVDLVPVDYTNYCMLEMCGHEVFRCNIKNLSFNTPSERDPVCRRAINAVVEASTKFLRTRSYLWSWALIDDQIFRRSEYAPKDFWPFDVEKNFDTCLECTQCCGIIKKAT